VLRRIAVFGSGREVDTPDAFAAAFEVGRLLGENGIVMIYAGAEVGPVATAAERARAAGGVAIGFPTGEEFRAEVAATADGILGLPGGFESLEEAFAVWGWSAGTGREQPLGLLDLDDSYSKLLRQASDRAVDRFVTESQRGLLILGREPEDLLRRLAEYRPPESRRQSADGEDFD
jgi:predicted Rossmann-fold nucleotide-binding protein